MRPIRLRILLLLLVPSVASAALQVFPTRVLLTNQRRVSQVTLRHIGSKSERYKITTIFYRMLADGSMQEVEQPAAGEHSIRQALRFSPREVLLPPNVEQVVRVMFYSSSFLEEGDYRAYLRFEPAGDEDGAAPNTEGGKKVAMQLSARVAVAIPVFFRQGSPKTEVSLSKLKLFHQPDGKLAFSVELNRTGKRYVYGDFKAYFRPLGAESEEVVAQVVGTSSYIERREARYPLNLALDRKDLGVGSLRLELHESAEEGGALLAQTVTELSEAKRGVSSTN